MKEPADARQSPGAAQQELLPAEKRRRGQSALIRASIGSAVYQSAMVRRIGRLFILALGGSSLHVGVLNALSQSGWLGQLIGAQVAPRVGKVRLLFLARVAAIPAAAALVVLAASGWIGPGAIACGLAAYGLMTLTRQIGQATWWPLIQDNTAGDAVGGFLVRLRTALRAIEIVVPLGVGLYLHFAAGSRGFAVPFLVGLVAMAAAAYFVRLVPESSNTDARVNVWLRCRLALRSEALRRYLLFASSLRLLTGLMIPFWVVMFTRGGMSNSAIIWVSTVQALGHMLGLRLWGGMVDRHGGRSTLGITMAGQSLMGLAWLAWLVMPTDTAVLVAWAIGFYLVRGFFQGGLMMGRTWVALGAVPTAYQTAGFTLINMTGAVSSAAGSLIGGVAFDAVLGGADEPNLHDGAIYLAAVQMALLGCWWFKARLIGFDKQVSARELMANLVRRMLGGSERE